MGTDGKAKEFIERYYELIDGGRLEDAMQMMAEDATLRFANNDVITGRAGITQALGALLDSLAGIRHDLVAVLDGDSPTVTFELFVTYLRKDGSQITIPGAVVSTIADGLFIDQRIYVDISPVFAPASSA